MGSKILSVLFLVSAAAAQAGPNAAVFCDNEDAAKPMKLAMFDIAVTDSSKILSVRIEHPAFATPVRGGHAVLTGDLRYYSERRAFVSYADSDGKRGELLDTSSNAQGRLRFAHFVNDSAVKMGSGTRTGSVVLLLEGAKENRLAFTRCKYQGGRVRNWASIFDQD